MSLTKKVASGFAMLAMMFVLSACTAQRNAEVTSGMIGTAINSSLDPNASLKNTRTKLAMCAKLQTRIQACNTLPVTQQKACIDESKRLFPVEGCVYTNSTTTVAQ